MAWGLFQEQIPRVVELQGVEPWSSQADPRLSTCLAFPWFWSSTRREAGRSVRLGFRVLVPWSSLP